MHFALITAPTITEFRTREEILSTAVQQAALQPQLGVLSVASILERWGDVPDFFDVNGEYLRYASTTDQFASGEFVDYFARLAVRSNADVYGFSSICSSFPLSLRIASAIKSLRPYATVLFGGPQASVVDEAVLQRFPSVDYILRGEVETSLPIFLRELCGNYRFGDVPGLTLRDGSRVFRTPSPATLEDLDALPSPAYHLSNYLQNATAASIELGRGCPFSCTFCSTNDFFRRRFRLRSPERVLADMRSIAASFGIRHFELVHDMFTVDRKRVVAFCEAMKSSGEDFTWDCSARTDCVDVELLQQMSESGCRGVFFGIESGSKRMQRIIDKDLDPDKAIAMLQACEDLGIRTTASLIVGFPEEDWTDVGDTLRIYLHSARCSQSHPQLNLLAPLAGTPLQTRHQADLILTDHYSGMSHQGLSQAEEELDLIRQHPDIFPSFYRIPSPGLEWEALFELREWLGMLVEHFRWLLCALARQTDLLDLHREWRSWRCRRNPVGSPGDLRRYYAQARSHADFLCFVAEGVYLSDPVAEALFQVETTLDSAAKPRSSSALPTPGQLAAGVHVLTLNYDLGALTAGIAAQVDPVCSPSSYATRRREDGSVRIHRIAPFLADVLTLYREDRQSEVAARISDQFPKHSASEVVGILEHLTAQLAEEGWIAFEPRA